MGAGSPRREPPPVLLRFAELVNRREYWASHEVLEDAWRERGSDFYHGLILYASAFVHALRGNAHGISAQLGKALDRLRAYPSPYLGLDVDEIREHARRCLTLVDRNEDDPRADWPAILPLPELEPRPRRVRGDEPELAPDVLGREGPGS